MQIHRNRHQPKMFIFGSCIFLFFNSKQNKQTSKNRKKKMVRFLNTDRWRDGDGFDIFIRTKENDTEKYEQ